ncbi:MAG: GHKL domain-containing protein [Lachnospiraceae bacterium]|nr:GHKL domain-containing protein [Lachnospiraceae bacterium]
MLTPLAVITSIIENLTLLCLMFYLAGDYPHPQKKFICRRNIALVIFSTIFLYFVQVFDDPNLHLGVVAAFTQYFIVVKMVTHIPIKNTIITVFVAYILECLFQLPMLGLCMWLVDDFSVVNSMQYMFFMMLFSALLTLLTIRFLPIKKLYRKILKIPGFILMGVLFIFTLIGIMSFFSDEVHAPHNITMVCFIIFLFLTFALVIFFAMRSQKKEQAIHYYETYLPILDDMILNIRKTQHNHNNAIQAIASLPQSATDYNSLASALEQYSIYMAKNTLPTQFLHFENKLLAALLYNKYCLAAEHGIYLDIAIHNHFYKSELTEFQIVDLCGILLDNALEACHAGDTIYVEIGTVLQENISITLPPFAFTAKNPGPEATQDFINKIFTTGYSSKTDTSSEHGLGLPYIKSLVQKHHGYIEVSNETIILDDTNKACQYFVIHVSA